MAVTAPDRLYVYNEALRILRARRLSSITEDREPRRVLDSAWGSSGEAVLFCLEQHDWNFATRSSQLERDPGIETEFGFQYAYAVPADMVRLTTLAADGYFRVPMVAAQYTLEAGYIYTDIEPLFIRYVSDDDSYGFNSGDWTMGFRKLVAGYLAKECASRLTAKREIRQEAEFAWTGALRHAQSRDEQDEGTKFPTPGSWVRARSSSFGRRRRDEA